MDDSVIVAQKTFRETQWFKLGQMEQPAQDQDGDEAEPSATVMMLPIEDRYSGSSITIEDSLTFGLHTGQTEAIKISFKTVSLPDEVPMALLVREMKSRRRFYAIAASVCAAFTALALFAI